MSQKQGTGNIFLMVLMLNSWWFVMFVMVFVVETIRIFVMFFFFSAGCTLNSIILLNIKFPQLSMLEATVGRNPNLISDKNGEK